MDCDLISLAVEGVQRLRPYQPGKPVDELRRELGIEYIVKLASNENPLGPSPQAVRAATKILSEIHRYPDGANHDLRTQLAALHGVEPQQVTPGNGSNDLLELLAHAYLGPGREAIHSRHAFAVYALATLASGGQSVITAPNDPDHPMPYGQDLEAMLAAITPRTRLIMLANPNNPTGTWHEAAELHAFLDRVPADVLVLIDEAYHEYAVGLQADFPDTTSWVAHYPNLVVTRTFSKAHGLAGLRVGYAVSHPQVAEVLNRVRQPFNVNMAAQAAALASLDDIEHMQRAVACNNAGLEGLQAFCREHALPVLPTAANFLTVQMPLPGREIYQRLLQQGVIARALDGYGLPQHLRLSIGTEVEQQRLLDVLPSVLQV